MTIKPSKVQLQRSATEMRADHRPRQLLQEPRISRADERRLAELARDRDRRATQLALTTTLERMTQDLETVKQQIGRVVPGDHRSYLREIEHGIKGLTDTARFK